MGSGSAHTSSAAAERLRVAPATNSAPHPDRAALRFDPLGVDARVLALRASHAFDLKECSMAAKKSVEELRREYESAPLGARLAPPLAASGMNLSPATLERWRSIG